MKRVSVIMVRTGGQRAEDEQVEGALQQLKGRSQHRSPETVWGKEWLETECRQAAVSV